MQLEDFAQLLGEALGLEQVLQAQRAARGLVLVCRPDAAPCRADLAIALGCLARGIERSVIRQDQRACFRDAQPRDDAVHTGRGELVHLCNQGLRRDDDSVADEAVDVLAQDAGRNQVQNGLAAADHQRVPGVVPALEADHALRMIGEPVDDLALALVAPLRTDDDDVARLAAHRALALATRQGAIRAAPASSRKPIENPVAGRGRPNAFPTSS